jgi:hypothetical protein
MKVAISKFSSLFHFTFGTFPKSSLKLCFATSLTLAPSSFLSATRLPFNSFLVSLTSDFSVFWAYTFNKDIANRNVIDKIANFFIIKIFKLRRNINDKNIFTIRDHFKIISYLSLNNYTLHINTRSSYKSVFT